MILDVLTVFQATLKQIQPTLFPAQADAYGNLNHLIGVKMKDSILPIHATSEKNRQRDSSIVQTALDPKTLSQFLWNAKVYLGVEQASNDQLFVSAPETKRPSIDNTNHRYA